MIASLRSLPCASLLFGAAACGALARTPEPRSAVVAGLLAPCPPTLSRPAMPAPGVHVAVACVSYDAEGETAEALAADMNERGPRDEGGVYHAYTAFELTYGYDERV